MRRIGNLSAKVLTSVLAGIMVIGITVAGASAASDTPEITPPQVLKGDINSDGEVNSTDLQYAKRYLMRKIGDGHINFENADMNNDGVIDSTDFSLLKRKILRLI